VTLRFAELPRVAILRPHNILHLYRGDDDTPWLQWKFRTGDAAHAVVDLLASFRAELARESAQELPPLVVNYVRMRQGIMLGGQNSTW